MRRLKGNCNEVYAGVIGTWQQWLFNFMITVEGINVPVGLLLMEIGKKSATPLTIAAFEPLVTPAIRTKHCAELFGVLWQLTTGDANAVVRGVTSKIGMGRCGFAAYYALSFRFNPKTPARVLQFLFTVINFPTIKDVRQIPKGIEEWEAKRSVMRDDFDETLSDRMAASTVTSMLPQEFQDIVFQNHGAGDVVYETVKDKVLSVAASRIQQSAPAPTDTGAANDEKTERAEEEKDEINHLRKGGKVNCYINMRRLWTHVEGLPFTARKRLPERRKGR